MQNTSKINNSVRENRGIILQATEFSQKKKKGTILKGMLLSFLFLLGSFKESSGEDKLLLDSHKPTIHCTVRMLRNTNLTSR